MGRKGIEIRAVDEGRVSRKKLATLKGPNGGDLFWC